MVVQIEAAPEDLPDRVVERARGKGGCGGTTRGLRRVAGAARPCPCPSPPRPSHSPSPSRLAVSLVGGGSSMPDLSYSALANWDGRLSAPGSVNGDEIPIPSGSRPSPSSPSASPRIDPTPNGFSHAPGSSAMVVERGGVGDSPNLLAERSERGAGSASEKVRRRANRSGRSLRGGFVIMIVSRARLWHGCSRVQSTWPPQPTIWSSKRSCPRNLPHPAHKHILSHLKNRRARVLARGYVLPR